jgi:hypothetical protein
MTSGGVLLLALFFQSATADAPATKARLALRGAADCIARGDLAARVAARTPRVQFVDDAAITAQVVLSSARPGNVVAELVLAAPGAEQTPRRFVARSCAEAADALALIIAVTLDPTLKRPGAEASPAAPAPADRVAPPTEKAPVGPATVAAAPPTAVATRRQFGVAVAGQTISGPAPALMPGIAVSGMLALVREGLWAPALFVGATHVRRSDLPELGGNASFSLDAATVDACPLRLAWSWFVARPCAAALLGRLNASGANTEDGASAARPFATAGVAVAASAGSTVEVTARVGVGVTLLRDSYEFGGMTFHRASPITTAASLGVGLRWP